MLVRKRSALSQSIHEMDLPITEQQLADWNERGEPFESIFKNLTPEQQLFLTSGVTPEESREFFGKGLK